MADLIGVCGRSGSGKSTSIENLNPAETFIISISGKALPFPQWKKKYPPLSADGKTGNYFKSSVAKNVMATMGGVSTHRPEIKNIVIDDYQYIMGFEFFKRAAESGFGKFAEIGKNGADPLIFATTLRDDLRVFVLTHDEEVSENFKPVRKMKTIGKMVDEKLTMEGLFTVVLFTEVVKNEKGVISHHFITNNDGSTTAKSPRGMFKDVLIPNDLALVAKAVTEYEG